MNNRFDGIDAHWRDLCFKAADVMPKTSLD